MRFTMSADRISRIMGALLLGASTDTTRPHLNCLCFDLAGRAIVATDGHRMGVHTLDPSDMDVAEVSPLAVALVSREDCVRVLKMIGKRANGPCEIAFTDGRATFRYGGTAMECKLVDVQYPPWREIMVEPWSRVNRYSGIAFNAAYMADCGKAFAIASDCNGVTLDMGGAADPIRVTNSSYPEMTWIVMPMRVGDVAVERKAAKAKRDAARAAEIARREREEQDRIAAEADAAERLALSFASDALADAAE